jgi:uncharacterized protein
MAYMIESSFIFLDSLGTRGEQMLWKQGICSWHDFLKREMSGIKGISPKRKLFYDQKMIEARKALYNNDSSYFAEKLSSAEAWRLYSYFRDEAVFLDIETTGFGSSSYLTVIGLFDGISTKTMIQGFNLDFQALSKELGKYKMIVTFNGASFDLPFIKKRHSGIIPNVPHLDLRVLCARIGLSGGLKQIEKQQGIRRREIVERFNGGDALTLWKMYRATGDRYYLELLVEYNEEDIINLKKIADFAVKKIEGETKADYFLH